MRFQNSNQSSDRGPGKAVHFGQITPLMGKDMIKKPILLAFCIICAGLTGQITQAASAKDALRCMTFSYANLKFEERQAGNRKLKEARRSEWLEQAAAFEKIALQSGQTEAQISAFVSKNIDKYVEYLHRMFGRNSYAPQGNRIKSKCAFLARKNPAIPVVKFSV